MYTGDAKVAEHTIASWFFCFADDVKVQNSLVGCCEKKGCFGLHHFCGVEEILFCSPKESVETFEMHKFFEKREMVSFSVSEGNHKIPEKKNYEKPKVSRRHFEKTTKTVLPDGSSVHLLVETIILDTDGTFTRINTKSHQHKNNEKHGKCVLSDVWASEKKRIRVEGNYRNGKPHGKFTRYVGDIVQETCEFSNGRLVECSVFLQPQGRLCQTILCREKNGTEHTITKIEMRDGSLCIEEQKCPLEGAHRERLRFFSPEGKVEELDEETEFDRMRERNISSRMLGTE
ncbi:hypothetical protein A9K97_gp303 [Tokyovirus A1]|uniref:hypothetical protein n=1 Tax=Tokyovirus A1 TaxID=1826170 RepID=UPI0007A97DDE|nr:hypothetical protein A9K97_gp303 [Tokyovirus A1]BAU80048.1 hypothetical protein [Tokyovirus A1]